MSEGSSSGWILRRPEIMPKGFDGDPEKALMHIRSDPWDRYNVFHFRAALSFFDGWRPAETALPWLERLLSYYMMAEMPGGRGPQRPSQPLADMKAIGEAVNATCLKASGEAPLADEVVTRARRWFQPSQCARAVLDARHSQILVQPMLGRFGEALELANSAVNTLVAAPKTAQNFVRPFCCRHKALLIRAYVKHVSYSEGREPVERLTESDNDVLSVLRRSRNQALRTIGVDIMMANAVQLSFAGLKSPTPPRRIPQGQCSEHQAKANWAGAILSCAANRYLTSEDQSVLLSSRQIFLDLNRQYDALLLTLDLQFWYVVSGQAHLAALESPSVRALLPILPTAHRDATVIWLHEIENLNLSYETAERVLREVRRVGRPQNLRNLIQR